MNSHYEKYAKGNRTSLIISYDTKEKLDKVMIKIGKKISYEKTILELINYFEISGDFNPYHNLNQQHKNT
jgi:hypothetical protein